MIQRREFIKTVGGIICAGVSGCALPILRQESNILIKPTENRRVDIYHRTWDIQWELQFPESVWSRDGVFMAWPKLQPEWKQLSENSWGYEWRPTPGYVAQQENFGHRDPEGNPIKRTYLLGLVVQPQIETLDNGLALKLNLRNESDTDFTDVRSEGGCFAARSDPFQGHDEVARSFIMQGGKMVSMKQLYRTKTIRCIYRAKYSEYDESWLSAYEWFWGRSSAKIDTPVIVGAVSSSGSKAVVLGWEHSTSGYQNADGHHCLHSQPTFGNIKANTASTRRGYILFGDKLDDLARDLRERIA